MRRGVVRRPTRLQHFPDLAQIEMGLWRFSDDCANAARAGLRHLCENAIVAMRDHLKMVTVQFDFTSKSFFDNRALSIIEDLLIWRAILSVTRFRFDAERATERHA